MPVLKTYSYKKTGELLREDQPYSIRTIERMVDVGDLERKGERMRRGITERSIIAYQNGERGIWRGNGKTTRAGASQEPAMLPKHKTGHGQGTSQRYQEDTMSEEDSIPARLPRHGVIRSSNDSKAKKMSAKASSA